MNLHTGTFEMKERDVVKVACPQCGWTADGELHIVDRYLTDYPPIPRGNGMSFLELRIDDPERHISECDRCEACLDVGEVVQAEDAVLLSQVYELAHQTSVVYQRLLEIVVDQITPGTRQQNAQHMLRMAKPLMEGALHEIRIHAQENPTS